MSSLSTAAKIFVGMGVTVALAGCNGGDGGGDNSGDFNFNTASPDHFVRVDRTGEPAIATALLSRTENSLAPVDGN